MKFTAITVLIILGLLSGGSGNNRVDEPVLSAVAQEQISSYNEQQPHEDTVESDMEENDLYIELDVDRDGHMEHIFYDQTSHAIQIMRQDEMIWNIPLDAYVTFGYSHRGAVNHFFDFAVDENEDVYLRIYTTFFQGELPQLGPDGEPDATKALIRYIRAHEYYLSLVLGEWVAVEDVAYTWKWDKIGDSERTQFHINGESAENWDSEAKYNAIPNTRYDIPYPPSHSS